MIRMRSQFALVLGLAGLLWLPVRSWGQDGRPAPEQAKEPAPAELANMPSGQVAVTYINRELKVMAKGVPLGRVLEEVCNQMGVALDFSPGTADEPVFTALGPGPAKDVIASLLEGSMFNYAMARSADDSNELASLTVFPKTKDSGARLVAHEQVGEQKVASTSTTPVEKNSGLNQLQELTAAAKAEGNGGAMLEIEMGMPNSEDPDAQPITTTVNVSDVLNLLEAQLKAAADNDSNSLRTGQQARAAASDAATADSGANALAAGRPRHRRHR
jgi:hypothetical protein